MTKNSTWHAVGAAALLAALAPTAGAADAIFLKLDGITGGSLNERHRNEIDLNSYAQAFRSAVNFGFGSGAGAGRVNCGDVTVLKNIDRATPDLIMHVTTGRHIREGTITFTRSGDSQVDYYVVKLRDIVVDAVEQIDPPGESGLQEKLSMKARQFQFFYTPLNDRGQPTGQPVSFGWDCISNTRF